MICWICKINKADSGEHKFKSSILKKMHGKPFKDNVMYGNGNNVSRIGKANNTKVKFPKVICQNCNNSITAKHDQAFEILINYSMNNYDSIYNDNVIDFERVYGSNWVDEKRNLYKYLAKHAGCKMVTGDIEFDTNLLSEFIYNDLDIKTFEIKFILKEGFKYLDKVFKYEGMTGLRFMSNGNTVYSMTRNRKVQYFAGMTTYNWLSICWVCTQNGVLTTFDGFNERKQDLMIFSFDEVPENLGENWFNRIDKQKMETLDKQIEFYNSLVKW